LSGGSGGGGLGGGFEPSGPPTPCEELKFTTSIASPQPVASELEVDEVLTVVLVTGPPASINLERSSGETVGSLITRVAELLRCIQDGVQFVAVLESIDGGDMRVRVRPA
jgi:hypothetical protein